MRKNAGFIIMTLLLLTIPALANAWNLKVTVAGGTDANNITVAYPGTVTPKVMEQGTFYLYPQGAATLATVGATTGLTMTLDGNPLAAGVLGGALTPLTSGNHIVVVTYAAGPTSTSGAVNVINDTVAHPGSVGGTVYSQNLNSTWNTTGLSGVAVGTRVPVTIAPDFNHVIVSYTVGSGPAVTAPFGNFVAGQTYAIPSGVAAVDGGVNVYATYALAAKTTAVLFAPTSFGHGNPAVAPATITVTSNDTLSTLPTPATATPYAFNLDGTGFVAQASNSYAISNLSVGSHTLQGQVTMSATGSFLTPVANILVVDTTVSNNTGCNSCHSTQPALHSYNVTEDCTFCHTTTPHVAKPSCTSCHAVVQTNPFVGGTPALVNDNAGVRAVVGEFSKWSHHIVNANGLAVQDEQCAVCHLEGKVGAEGLEVDATKHMVDSVTHLRNAHDDSDMQWDPAAPNHTTMDNFCMSCHSATGADSPVNAQLQALIKPLTGIAASPTNPFGDTISNRYDKMMRPAVTNVDDQFNTGNNSHHGVKGPRYSGRTRIAGPRQIANLAAFKANSSATLQGVRSTIFDAGNLNQLYVPLANAGGEAAPRTGAATLGDDSTLHCGDCHTVGQFRAADVVVAVGSFNQAVIGAHGSNNEYMLRNSIGTDARHTQNAYTVSAATNGANGNVVTQTNPNGAFLVCYNCHSFNKYGSTFIGTGADAGNAAGNPLSNIQSHAGEYASAGRCNGAGNTLPFAGYTTCTATDGSQFGNRIFGNPASARNGASLGYVGEQAAQYGNIFGIQCLDCHNSGIGNAYGGIHGSANDTTWFNGTTTITPASLGAGAGGYYINGMGNATKVERFLPGLGDAMHTPGTLGGVTGGSSFTPAGATYSITTGGIANDTNWEQKHWQQTATTVINFANAGVTGNVTAGAGCYTLGATQQVDGAIITSDMTSGLRGPSVTGAGGPATFALDTWGGCDDHTAGQGKGNHGFLKRIVRPVTY